MKRVFTPVKKKTILIVDDDQLVDGAYREKLQQRGFNVEVASTGNAALQRLALDPAQLVLLDLCLPGINGIELLREIRAKFADVPVIVFANPYLTSLARSAQEEGAAKCLTKADCTPGKLFQIVQELLAPGQVASQVESDSLEELSATLLINASDVLANLRAGHQAFARAKEEEARLAELRDMHRQVRLFAAAGIVGLQKISQMANAFEALLIELHAKPKKITPSVIRTVAQAVDTLATLLQQAAKPPIEKSISSKILVVDDEIISRETICAALEKAALAGVSMDDSLAAQRELEQEHFDLIFLDVEMPGLSGFELCKKIRETTANRTTPVVFVTAHSDFGSRAQSALSGGNDFITKPFLSGELAVKALACLFKEKPRAIASAAIEMPAIRAEELANSGS